MECAGQCNNQLNTHVDHKSLFEAESRDCLRDSHKCLALRTKEHIICNIVYGHDFMEGVVFKEAIIHSRYFTMTSYFQTSKYLWKMMIEVSC
jgi:hypothetical protein